MVFEKLNEELKHDDVFLSHLTFELLHIGSQEVKHSAFSEDAGLVRAVEQLLICSFKRQEQYDWNRA